MDVMSFCPVEFFRFGSLTIDQPLNAKNEQTEIKMWLVRGIQIVMKVGDRITQFVASYYELKTQMETKNK